MLYGDAGPNRIDSNVVSILVLVVYIKRQRSAYGNGCALRTEFALHGYGLRLRGPSSDGKVCRVLTDAVLAICGQWPAGYLIAVITN